jgi:galactoside O-acetyltransferase
MTHLSKKELLKFKSIGKYVKVSSKASFHNPGNISIGDYSRIDDFCVISAGDGGIEIGRNVHIAVFVALIGAGKIIISDFAGISARTSIYSSNDDYSGKFLTGPTVPSKYTNVTKGEVFIGKHVVVGAGSIILPNVSIGEGSAIGALSLVTENCLPFSIYLGIPARRTKERLKKLFQLESNYLTEDNASR